MANIITLVGIALWFSYIVAFFNGVAAGLMEGR